MDLPLGIPLESQEIRCQKKHKVQLFSLRRTLGRHCLEEGIQLLVLRKRKSQKCGVYRRYRPLYSTLGYTGMVPQQMGGPIPKMKTFGNAVQMLSQNRRICQNVQVRVIYFQSYFFCRNVKYGSLQLIFAETATAPTASTPLKKTRERSQGGYCTMTCRGQKSR